jgi:glycosyltransferase involved in cell wall biosynthesis
VRILIIHNRYREPGGEDVVVETEASLLLAEGHEVLLFEKSNENAQGWKGACNSIWSSTARDEIGHEISRFRPDIAHVHNVFHAISPAVYGMIADQGVPIVQTLHNFRLFCIRGTFERKGRICERCEGRSLWRGAVLRCYRDSWPASTVLATGLQLHRFLATFERHVLQFIALNEFCRRKFITCGLPADRISVKPNFSDIADVGENHERIGGLYVGRMVTEKGIDVLADALLLSPSPFTAIGDGPMAQRLHGLRDVAVVGRKTREEVFQYMRGAAYLVMPSVWYETFGLVMIEAFACRLPVIASDIGAMAELVEDGKTGLLFKAGSPSDLAEKIKWANNHPADIRRMGDAARLQYERSFTSKRNYELLMAIYQKAMRSDRAAVGTS